MIFATRTIIRVILLRYTYICMSSCTETSNFNRLHLNKICLCCFSDMLYYSNNLSTIATTSLLNISELLQAFLLR